MAKKENKKSYKLEDDEKSILLIVDKELHKKFKAKCALEEVEQKQKITELIQDYVKDFKG